MHWRLYRALALPPLLAVIACQQPPDLSAEIDQYAALINDERFLICNCPQDAGYDTMAECDEALGRVDEDDKACLQDVIEGNEEEGKAYLDCVNEKYQEHTECLEANVNCEGGMIEACAQQHTAALEQCPSLPDGIHQAFGACTV